MASSALRVETSTTISLTDRPGHRRQGRPSQPGGCPPPPSQVAGPTRYASLLGRCSGSPRTPRQFSARWGPLRLVAQTGGVAVIGVGIAARRVHSLRRVGNWQGLPGHPRAVGLRAAAADRPRVSARPGGVGWGDRRHRAQPSPPPPEQLLAGRSVRRGGQVRRSRPGPTGATCDSFGTAPSSTPVMTAPSMINTRAILTSQATGIPVRASC